MFQKLYGIPRCHVMFLVILWKGGSLWMIMWIVLTKLMKWVMASHDMFCPIRWKCIGGVLTSMASDYRRCHQLLVKVPHNCCTSFLLSFPLVIWNVSFKFCRNYPNIYLFQQYNYNAELRSVWKDCIYRVNAMKYEKGLLLITRNFLIWMICEDMYVFITPACNLCNFIFCVLNEKRTVYANHVL